MSDFEHERQPIDDVRYITPEALYAAEMLDDILPLPDDIRLRNQEVLRHFGDDSRLLTISPGNAISSGESATAFRKGVHKTIITALVRDPEAWLPLSTILYALGSGTSVQDYINKRFPGDNVVVSKVIDGNTCLKVAPDLIIMAAQPALGEDDKEPKTPATKVNIESVVPVFADPKLVKSNHPDRFGTIVNIADVNLITRLTVEQMAKKNPNSPFAKTRSLVFLDDLSAEIDGSPYERGPLATRIMHELLKKYLTKEPVSVDNLPLTDGVIDLTNVYRQFRSLAARGAIILQEVPDGQMGTRAFLLPTLFTDKRQS